MAVTRRVVHSWNLSPGEAIALQKELLCRVETGDRLPAPVRRVAGVDASFPSGGALCRAAVAVLSLPELALLEYAIAEVPAAFPYIPGLLSFREIPAVLAAMQKLRTLPDLLLCDGQGLAHPRRMGFASHLGLACDLPTIGVAKTRLIGCHGPVPTAKGAWTPLLDGDEVIGAALRTRACVRPLYISIGHRISLPTALRYTMACVTRYRLPETTRWADRLAARSDRPWVPNANRPGEQKI